MQAVNVAHFPVLTRAVVCLLPATAAGWPALVSAQCLSTISSFPYVETFEAGPGWTSGGSGNDWAWGAPAHPLINAAAEGSNAWCAGGLTGTFYNYGEQSWLESPVST